MRRSVRWLIALLSVLAVCAAGSPTDAAPARPMAFGVTISSIQHLQKAEALARTHPFVARVPIDWTESPAEVAQKIRLVDAAAARGWRVIVSLRYRTVPDDALTDLHGGFRAWVSSIADRMSTTPRLSIEISNRPNAPSPDVDTQADPIAVKALVDGVVAAAQASPSTDVGFSWFASGVVAYDGGWWALLESIGGRALRGRVRFVGVQLYPGSQGPGAPWALGGPRGMVEQILRETRMRYMPLLGFDERVAIEVSEFGAPVLAQALPYASGEPDVDQSMGTPGSQARMLKAMADGIWAAAEPWKVRSAAWTTLADPAQGCFLERCWGVVTSAGSERPAFDELRYQISLASLS